MNNGKQPITPTMFAKCGDGADDYTPLKDGQKSDWAVKFSGLTKREYFAGQALQGLLSLYDQNEQNTIVPNEDNVKYMAMLSVKAADALLAELSNGGGQ